MNESKVIRQQKVGILGGGQLGRMLFPPSLDLDIPLYFLDPNPESPCLQFCRNAQVGDFNDYQTVLDFGRNLDVISVEIEHVNTKALHELEAMGKKVYPQPNVLDIIKDKGLQKEWYKENGIPTADFYLAQDASQVKESFPFVQKLRQGGYDGKGVQVINGPDDLHRLFKAPSVVENKVPFEQELAVLVARNASGEVTSYPVVGMDFDHQANLVSFLYSPANVSKEIERKARELAEELIEKLSMVGLLAVEFFLTKDGNLLVNEVAPRPHNSGHHTIEGNITSQYEQHLRAILDLPLGKTDIKQPAVMVNLLGAEGHTGLVKYEGMKSFLEMPGIHFHLYGKRQTKPYRKMGHVTIIGADIGQSILLGKQIKESVKVVA